LRRRARARALSAVLAADFAREELMDGLGDGFTLLGATFCSREVKVASILCATISSIAALARIS
jgi:hypothetical protein